MKLFFAATTTAIALGSMAIADGHSRDVEALFAMSNNSAAEVILGDTSMGDISVAQMRFALGNMSSAERMSFFEADDATRSEILAAQIKLMDGDSAAEASN